MPPARLASQAHARAARPIPLAFTAVSAAIAVEPHHAARDPCIAVVSDRRRVCARPRGARRGHRGRDIRRRDGVGDGAEVRASQEERGADDGGASDNVCGLRSEQSGVRYRDVSLSLGILYKAVAYIWYARGWYSIYRCDAGQQLDVSVLYNNLCNKLNICASSVSVCANNNEKASKQGKVRVHMDPNR